VELLSLLQPNLLRRGRGTDTRASVSVVHGLGADMRRARVSGALARLEGTCESLFYLRSPHHMEVLALSALL